MLHIKTILDAENIKEVSLDQIKVDIFENFSGLSISTEKIR